MAVKEATRLLQASGSQAHKDLLAKAQEWLESLPAKDV